ncbi:immunity 26/phosphotriesterase HocA family protein [Stenotrophomonas sp. SI-NJAU-1]|uniref:Imm26 family immunity protein n=1 Tax=unclassified Stenotrophomonas TaxID=196198 RepID=UPI000E3C57BA|nr:MULTISPECIES: Imm26 family immunity protein [unclassified Stenotrophomonas]UEX19999.1 immunity 26/phosphotriesterase HocA family protein [Stenotrophomonas sp. SI-NJAU-1]
MPKKFKVEVGDVFAVPLPKGGYGVGRIIHISDRWRLAQFIDLQLGVPEMTDSVVDFDEVMPVHNIVTLRIEDGSWPILQKGVMDALPDLKSLVFYRGLPAKRTYVNLSGEVVPECHRRDCASSMPQFAEYIAEVLEEALAGRV